MKHKKSDPKVALRLFLYFFKIGWFTFGGGFSILAQMQKDFVEKRHEVNEEELLDQISIGRSLPGLMVTNVTYLFGYAQGGLLAGLASIIGIIMPPVIMLSVVTMCYSAFRSNEYVSMAMSGCRAAVPPIIAMAALKLRKGAFVHGIPSYVIALAALLISLLTDVNIVYLVLGGAALGILLSEVKNRGAA